MSMSSDLASPRSASPSPLEETAELFLFTEALRRHFLRNLPLEATLLPSCRKLARDALRKKRATRSPPDECDDLNLATVATWLLVETLHDPHFSPVRSANLREHFPSSAELDHLMRSLSWLQLELRKAVYMGEMECSNVAVAHHYRESIINNGGLLRSAPIHSPNLEDVFGHAVRYVTAGMGAVAEDLMIECGLSHLAAPLYTSFLPVLNLVDGAEGDFYQDLLLGDMMPGAPIWEHLGRTWTRGDLQRVAKFRGHAVGVSIQEWQQMAEMNDIQYGTETQSAMLDWTSSLKAEAALREGKGSEFAFYCLMSGCKRRREASFFPQNWHAQMFIETYCRLRELWRTGLSHHPRPRHGLLQLEGSLMRPARREHYREGGAALSGGLMLPVAEGRDLADCFEAAAQCPVAHEFEPFFRRIYAALILNKAAALLTDVRDGIQSLISSGSDSQQLCSLTLANVLVFLMNAGHLKKRSLTPDQLGVLDEVLERALRIAKAKGQFLLIPFFARHLRSQALTDWFCDALRGYDGQTTQQKRYLFQVCLPLFPLFPNPLSEQEGRFWLDTWEGAAVPGFPRPDDPTGQTLTMMDVILSNIEVAYSHLECPLEESKAALQWVGVAGDLASASPDIRQHLRNLLFSLFSETAFTAVDVALGISCTVASFVSQQEVGTWTWRGDSSQGVCGEVSGKDLRKWVQFCRIRRDCQLFFASAAESGLQISPEGRLRCHEARSFGDAFVEDDRRVEICPELLQQGLATYWEGIDDIILDEFFFERLFLPAQLEKYKIEFVVGRQAVGTERLGPFTEEELPHMQDVIEKFVNALLACDTDNAACASVNAPLPRRFTIRLEFRPEALQTALLGLVASFMKGTFDRMPPLAIAHISAPLALQKHLANIRAKSLLLKDLLRIHQILKKAAPLVNEIQSMEDMATYILERRHEVFEEERILDVAELQAFLQERAHSLVDEICRGA